MQVYSLVSSAKRHSPDFIQWPPGHRTRSFISHVNSPGSIQPGCHFSAHGTVQTQKPSLFYQVPMHLLLGRESARVSKVPCLGAHRRSIFSAAVDRTRDLLLVSRACRLPPSHDPHDALYEQEEKGISDQQYREQLREVQKELNVGIKNGRKEYKRKLEKNFQTKDLRKCGKVYESDEWPKECR